MADRITSIRENAMTPWIISQDLMRANEEDLVRATRYAHHRAHTYRRPGRFLASLRQAWMSKLPIPLVEEVSAEGVEPRQRRS